VTSWDWLLVGGLVVLALLMMVLFALYCVALYVNPEGRDRNGYRRD